MNVTFSCPRCDQPARREIALSAAEYHCPHCGQAILIPRNAFDKDQETIGRCIACPSTELFVRKDFPQQLGVAIVALGFIASSIPWAYGYPVWTYAILFATALADVLLYLLVPNCLMCYRCGAQYRGLPNLEQHSAFDLETHERHRQQLIRQQELGAGLRAHSATTAVLPPAAAPANSHARTDANET
jgi:DNA-directed RNA polymerase subunit RPC12/RpoP